ncbi:MAG: neutral/alkaline non-lysosomal ceramidase N-terminal domain-containing protein [Anaerolineae bacterium]|nr:neutral/alkaline non-lysosomal ceramidase N-terminal domain-containing protein [Anaerolineae bacterium]
MNRSFPEAHAGVARTLITPPRGVYLIGYGDRTVGNRGVHDDLTATALVFAIGDQQTALVALDVLTINEFTVDRIRQALAPLPIILCCSHTHSGPITYADAKSSHRNQDYVSFLVAQVCNAVRQAQTNLLPVRFEYSRGECDVGINRRERMADGHMEIGRNPKGVRDASLQVVSIWRNDGSNERLATLVNYACHGTVLGPDNLLVSADWIGAMRQDLERRMGGLVLFLQGAAANINPDMYWDDANAFGEVEAQGLRVAESVAAAIGHSSIPLDPNPLSLMRETVWLPTETAVRGSRPPRHYGRELLRLANMPVFLLLLADLLLKRRYPWKPVIAAHDGYWSVPMRINVLRLGEAVVVTYAAETFTEIGLRVKAASPARYTLFASVTDGCISYLPTSAAHDEGGYEVDTAPLAYRYPGRLQAACEEIALQATIQCIDQVFGVQHEKESNI